jgi:hypothetical protein
VFGAGEYSPATTVGQTLIEHEMLHSMLNKGNVGLVGFWGEEDHKKITSKVASEVVGDQIFAFQLASNSGLMDVKGKRIFGTLPRFLPQYLGAKAGIDVYPLDPTGIVKKGEGPDHGEDGNYMNPDKNAAKAANKSVQDKYLRVAVNHHKSMEAKRRSGEPVHKIGSASEKMFEALGDACHVAQDRGSHGEGTKGMGHDDPRTKTGWNPDSPTENAAGYSEAVQNTRSLMEDFVRLRSG